MDIPGFSNVTNEVELLRKSLYFGFVDITSQDMGVMDLIQLLLPETDGSSHRIERNGDMYFVYQMVDGVETMTISFYFDEKRKKFRLLFDAFDTKYYDERTMRFSM